MNNLLLYSGIILIICSYLCFLILYIIERNKKVNDNSLELILKREDNSTINVIKDADSIFSKYNISRNMIKLADDSYDSNDLFSLSVSYILSGYAKCKNKLILVSKIFKEIKIISFLPVITILVALVCNSRYDSMIGLFVLGFILIYLYMIDLVNNELIDDYYNDLVISSVKKIIVINKIFFIATLIIFIKLILNILL